MNKDFSVKRNFYIWVLWASKKRFFMKKDPEGVVTIFFMVIVNFFQDFLCMGSNLLSIDQILIRFFTNFLPKVNFEFSRPLCDKPLIEQERLFCIDIKACLIRLMFSPQIIFQTRRMWFLASDAIRLCYKQLYLARRYFMNHHLPSLQLPLPLC